MKSVDYKKSFSKRWQENKTHGRKSVIFLESWHNIGIWARISNVIKSVTFIIRSQNNNNPNFFLSISTPGFSSNVKETLFSHTYLPKYNIWCNLATFSTNEISTMKYLEKWLKLVFFHMDGYRNICLWFKIVLPLAGSMAGHKSPVHIQSNVTISGTSVAHIKNTKLHLPGNISLCFLLISAWVRVPSKGKILQPFPFHTNYLTWSTDSWKTQWYFMN